MSSDSSQESGPINPEPNPSDKLNPAAILRGIREVLNQNPEKAAQIAAATEEFSGRARQALAEYSEGTAGLKEKSLTYLDHAANYVIDQKGAMKAAVVVQYAGDILGFALPYNPADIIGFIRSLAQGYKGVRENNIARTVVGCLDMLATVVPWVPTAPVQWAIEKGAEFINPQLKNSPPKDK